MRVVSNTSPICNLAVIERLDLLQHRYGEIVIASEVWLELSQLHHPAGLAAITRARSDGWLRVVILDTDQMLSFQPSLDPGETAAISLAKYLDANLLLIDELKGRNAARTCGLRVAGLLGELLYAKKQGTISSVKNEITLLKQEAGFFIRTDLEQYLLREAGET
jgi:predicted nucleic acid-binding protein